MTDAVFDRPILIADDEPANVLLLDKLLRRAGYANVRGTTDAHAVLPLYVETRPDLLLLDLHMPGRTGFDVLDGLRAVVGAEAFVPVLVLTADTTAATRERALAGGATDFLTKPFDSTEVQLRVRNLLRTHALYRRLEGQNQVLGRAVRDRTADLEEARLEALERLSRASEFRDDDTGQHTQRVGRTAARLAAALGWSAPEVELIRRAAPLHDVGKIGIPDAVLLKPGRLTTDEMRVMQTHTTIGGRILGGSRVPVLRWAEQIALTHHECWDGSGYPGGLRGTDIPAGGRVVSVADVFDALTHDRPYKVAWPTDRAAGEIARLAGTKFDPRVAAAFADLYRNGSLDAAEAALPTPPPARAAVAEGI